jgi:hypothetical protein
MRKLFSHSERVVVFFTIRSSLETEERTELGSEEGSGAPNAQVTVHELTRHECGH